LLFAKAFVLNPPLQNPEHVAGQVYLTSSLLVHIPSIASCLFNQSQLRFALFHNLNDVEGRSVHEGSGVGKDRFIGAEVGEDSILGSEVEKISHESQVTGHDSLAIFSSHKYP